MTSLDQCSIRLYGDSDDSALLELMTELQDSLRKIDEALPIGREMAADYLRYTHKSCREQSGRILVAATADAVIGFATVLTRVPYDSPDSPKGYFAYLMDLVVHAPWRGHGVGSALMAAAEDAALAAGATELRTLVLHGNRAVNLYRRGGMTDYSLTLRKPLRADPSSSFGMSRTLCAKNNAGQPVAAPHVVQL